jgi:hypothetical protein
MAVVRVRFLGRLDAAGHLATDLDRPDRRVGVGVEPVVERIDVRFRRSPPTRNSRVRER